MTQPGHDGDERGDLLTGDPTTDGGIPRPSDPPGTTPMGGIPRPSDDPKP